MVFNAFAIIALRLPVLIATFIAPYFLDANQFGRLMLFITIATFLSIFLNANIAVGYGRSIYDKVDPNKFLTQAILFTIICHLLVLILLALLNLYLAYQPGFLLLITMSGMWSVDIMLHQVSIKKGIIHKFILYMFLKYLVITIICIATSAVKILQFDHSFMLLEGCVIPLLCLLIFLKTLKIDKLEYNQFWNHVRHMLRFSLPMIVYNICLLAISQSDRFILGIFHGNELIGRYSYFYTLASFVNIGIISFLNSKLVTFYQNRSTQEAPKDFIFYKLHFIYVGGGGAVIFSGYFFLNFLPSDMQSHLNLLTYTLSALAFGLVFQQVSRELAYQKKTTLLMLTTIVGASLNLILNLLLVPHLAAIGALVATGISFFVMSIVANMLTFGASSLLFGKILLICGTAVGFLIVLPIIEHLASIFKLLVFQLK